MTHTLLFRQMLDRPWWDFLVSSSSLQSLLNFHKKVSRPKQYSLWKLMLTMVRLTIITFIWKHLETDFLPGLALLCVQCTSEESSDCMVNIQYFRKIYLAHKRYAKKLNFSTYLCHRKDFRKKIWTESFFLGLKKCEPYHILIFLWKFFFWRKIGTKFSKR